MEKQPLEYSIKDFESLRNKEVSLWIGTRKESFEDLPEDIEPVKGKLINITLSEDEQSVATIEILKKDRMIDKYEIFQIKRIVS